VAKVVQKLQPKEPALTAAACKRRFQDMMAEEEEDEDKDTSPGADINLKEEEDLQPKGIPDPSWNPTALPSFSVPQPAATTLTAHAPAPAPMPYGDSVGGYPVPPTSVPLHGSALYAGYQTKFRVDPFRHVNFSNSIGQDTQTGHLQSTAGPYGAPASISASFTEDDEEPKRKRVCLRGEQTGSGVVGAGGAALHQVYSGPPHSAALYFGGPAPLYDFNNLPFQHYQQ
jgi:hypothetical protein